MEDGTDIEKDIVLSQKGSLHGNISKVGGGLSIANVKVTTDPASQTVYTDSDGNYLLEYLEPGNIF